MTVPAVFAARVVLQKPQLMCLPRLLSSAVCGSAHSSAHIIQPPTLLIPPSFAFIFKYTFTPPYSKTGARAVRAFDSQLYSVMHFHLLQRCI